MTLERMLALFEYTPVFYNRMRYQSSLNYCLLSRLCRTDSASMTMRDKGSTTATCWRKPAGASILAQAHL
jgi:hypothetical protein